MVLVQSRGGEVILVQKKKRMRKRINSAVLTMVLVGVIVLVTEKAWSKNLLQ